MKSRALKMTLVLTGILSIFALYIGLRLSLWSYTVGFSAMPIWISLIACVLLQGLGYLIVSLFPFRRPLFAALTWIGQILLGLFICLLLFTVAADIISIALRFFLSMDQQMLMEKITFFAVVGLTLLAAIGGLIQARLIGPRIYQVEVPLPNLPKNFDGFRLVQISDLHIGPTIGRRYIGSVVNKVNRLEPDVVILTGDIVDGPVTHLKSDLQPLLNLRSKYGHYLVTGNHEYYWDALAWLEEYRAVQLQPLLNEHVVFRREESHIVLAGITDYTAARMLPNHAYDVEKAFREAPTEAIKILLSHQPTPYEQVAAAGTHLQISGHTHGGQFFPGNVVVKAAQKYLKGLYRHKDMWIYVSRGTGYWGPPLRFIVPSEITLISLRRASHSASYRREHPTGRPC
jgi:predicted MPP superfamily phosphohydrolase